MNVFLCFKNSCVKNLKRQAYRRPCAYPSVCGVFIFVRYIQLIRLDGWFSSPSCSCTSDIADIRKENQTEMLVEIRISYLYLLERDVENEGGSFVGVAFYLLFSCTCVKACLDIIIFFQRIKNRQPRRSPTWFLMTRCWHACPKSEDQDWERVGML